MKEWKETSAEKAKDENEIENAKGEHESSDADEESLISIGT